MDLRLPPSSLMGSMRPAVTPPAVAAGTSPAASTRIANTQGEFSNAFKSALQAVSAAQNQASKLQREVTLDNPAVSLEETMVAIQKAQIAFQATVHVRNRMVQAYTDIMNMQV